MPDFLFRSAVMKTTSDGLNNQDRVGTLHLIRAASEWKVMTRRPLRLRLAGTTSRSGQGANVETTIEMSRSEAYAFSEWLDAAVTQSFTRARAKRGLRQKEN